MYKWSLRNKVNNYEVSSRGDKRFSAFYAKLSDGRSIEEHYQVDVKGYKTISEGKGKPPRKKISFDVLYKRYKKLWERYFNENPELVEDLMRKAEGKIITDSFANSPVNQARAICELLNERSKKWGKI